MGLTILKAGPQMRAELTGDLTIAEASETRDALALALTTSAHLDLELEALESVDIAGLQVLLALARQPQSLRFGKPSPALRQVLDLLQIDLLDAPVRP